MIFILFLFCIVIYGVYLISKSLKEGLKNSKIERYKKAMEIRFALDEVFKCSDDPELLKQIEQNQKRDCENLENLEKLYGKS